MLRLARQKQKLDFQWRKQEEERLIREQAAMFAKPEEGNRSRLAEATLAGLDYNEDVLEASKSL